MVAIGPPSTQQVTGSVASPTRRKRQPASPLIASGSSFREEQAWQAPARRHCAAYCLIYSVTHARAFYGAQHD